MISSGLVRKQNEHRSRQASVNVSETIKENVCLIGEGQLQQRPNAHISQ